MKKNDLLVTVRSSVLRALIYFRKSVLFFVYIETREANVMPTVNGLLSSAIRVHSTRLPANLTLK